MTAQNGGAARETRWEFPNHLSAARAVVVDTLPKVLEGYDPLEFWGLEKEVTSRLMSRTSQGNEVRSVTFKFWPIINVSSLGFWPMTNIHYIILRLEKKSHEDLGPSGITWMPIFMEIGPGVPLKKRFCFSDTRRGIVTVRFKVVERVGRGGCLHRDLTIAEVQVR